jgi:hypothetical protein
VVAAEVHPPGRKSPCSPGAWPCPGTMVHWDERRWSAESPLPMTFLQPAPSPSRHHQRSPTPATASTDHRPRPDRRPRHTTTPTPRRNPQRVPACRLTCTDEIFGKHMLVPGPRALRVRMFVRRRSQFSPPPRCARWGWRAAPRGSAGRTGDDLDQLTDLVFGQLRHEAGLADGADQLSVVSARASRGSDAAPPRCPRQHRPTKGGLWARSSASAGHLPLALGFTPISRAVTLLWFHTDHVKPYSATSRCAGCGPRCPHNTR